MSYTRINPNPQLSITTRDVVTTDVTTTANTWTTTSGAVPSVSGYTPIGVMGLSADSPTNLTLIGWVLSSSTISVRFMPKNAAAHHYTATIVYAKVS